MTAGVILFRDHLEGLGVAGDAHEHQDGQHHGLGDKGGDNGGQAGQSHQGVQYHNAQVVAGAGAHLLPAGVAPVQAHGQGVAEEGTQHGGAAVHHHGAALGIAVPHGLGGLDALKGGQEVVDLQGDDHRQEGDDPPDALENVPAAEGGRVKSQVLEGGGEVVPGEVPAAPGDDRSQHHGDNPGGELLEAPVRLAQVVDDDHAEGQQGVDRLVEHHGDAHKGQPHQRRGGHVAHKGAVGHHLHDPPADKAAQHLDHAANEGGGQPHLEGQLRVAGLPVDRQSSAA